MSMSDPLADFLTRIRNGMQANFTSVDIPLSKLKVRVADVLKKEGYIAGYDVDKQGVQGTLTIELKYGPNNEGAITGIRRASRPGLRQYKKGDAVSFGLEKNLAFFLLYLNFRSTIPLKRTFCA
ncbi:MAG: 30S ribosomal protein S8 [Candidatus Electrothrix sp. MAN1_4]|nr:30S ribosomal protein S8 [Candidatus Electrothrix sp. MAN1_4]